jgi:hypothetical protein
MSALTSGTKIRREGQGNSAGKKQQMFGVLPNLRGFLAFSSNETRVGAVLALAASTVLLEASPALAEKRYDSGASDTEIAIGQTHSYSGPASAFSVAARASSTMQLANRLVWRSMSRWSPKFWAQDPRDRVDPRMAVRFLGAGDR